LANGIISTLAGNGVAGFSGDGGPAGAAQLNHPVGVAGVAAGTVYIADFNVRVRKVSTGGIITVAGNGSGGFAGDGGPGANASKRSPSYAPNRGWRTL
jgi:hypothetical protein